MSHSGRARESSPPFRIEKLDLKTHDRSLFCSGSEPLDTWFEKQAGQQVRSHATVVYVAIEVESGRIAGFHSLSASTIVTAEMPEKLVKKLKVPRYPNLPAILLGRLAIGQNYQGLGLGKALLVDAVRKTCSLVNDLGAVELLVDAKDDNARSFYRHFGFIEFENEADRLFLPTATLLQL